MPRGSNGDTIFEHALNTLSMKGSIFSSLIITALVTFSSCHTAKQSATATPRIDGKYWKLVELNGAKVSVGQTNKEVNMILNSSENRVNGNGGCNSFFGSYELQGDNGIRFSKIGATKMACPDGVMQVENSLFQVFEMTSQFTFAKDTLILSKAGMPPLAKFVAGESK